MAEIFDQEFKRINFFKGFLTTAEDWNAAENYHVKKRQLHNLIMHGPGVLPHFKEGLKVASRGKGDLSIEISPGYAVDGQGHDLLLMEPVIKTLNPGDYKLPQTVYVVIKYIEELDDYIAYKENLEYKGHKTIAERVKIEISSIEPDIKSEVEVARIALGLNVKRIVDAKNPFNPGENEIDLRFVPTGGIAGTFLSPSIMLKMKDFFRLSKIAYAYLFHDQKIGTASDVLHGLVTFDMLLDLNLLDLRNIFPIFNKVLELQLTMLEDIERNYPEFSARKEFGTFKKNVRLLKGLYIERRFDYESLQNFIGYQEKSIEALKSLFEERIVMDKVAEAPKLTEQILEKIKIYSDDMSDAIEIEDVRLRVVDKIEPVDAASEEAHAFKIEGESDRYKTRQRLKYPDGKEVEDAGVAFIGGQVTFKVGNLTPGKDLLYVQKMDYVYGDWTCEIFVGSKKVGDMVCSGEDRKNRWRNWPFVIPGENITGDTITIRQKAVSSDRDINMFKLIFMQQE